MFDLPFQLPPNWEITTVGELVKRGIIEKPLDGNHGGTHPKSSDYVAAGIPFVMASDLDAGRVTFDTCKFISIEQAKSLRKGFSKEGDVLISHKATIGRTAIVQNNEFEFLMLTPQVTYYRVKDLNKLNNIYLKAYFDSSYFQTILNLWAGAGSTRAYLGITDQLKLPVILPTLEAQLYIADISLKLNNKIHLNTQTNQTLESIAQTIFKSWFVDFEPVKAKMAVLTESGTREQAELAAMSAISGKNEIELAQMQKENFEHYSQLAETAALFPSAMVESELGEMPEGWEVVGFSDIVSKYIDNRGKTPPTQETGIPLLEVKHLPDGSIKPDLKTDKFVDKDTYENWFRAHLESDDLIMSTVGTIGRLCMVPPNSKMAIAQNLLGLRFNRSKVSPYFMYYQMNDFRFKNDVDARLVITVQASIKRKDLETIDLLSAPIVLQEKFELFIKPFVLSQHSNENQNLAELRDSLLPKLLSGEIDLSEIQSEVA